MIGITRHQVVDAHDETPAVPRRPAGVSAAAPPLVRFGRLILPVLVLALGVAGGFILPSHMTYAASTALCYGLVGLGLYLPLATLRELPLNGAALAGLSAYWFAYHAGDGGAGNWLLGIGAGVGLCVLVSVAGGLASLVVTGLYFTVASLVVQIGIEKVVFSIGDLTGGAAGRGVAQPTGSGFFTTTRLVFMIAATACVALSLFLWRVKRSRALSNWMMTGHQPDGADAAGIRRWVQKAVIFGASGLVIGVAGVLFAFVNGTPPPPPQFGVIWSVIFLAIPIASGMRSIAAVWAVAALFTALPVILESHHINPNILSATILLFALLVGQSQDAVITRIRRLLHPDSLTGTAASDTDGVLPVKNRPVVGFATRPESREIDLATRPRRDLVGVDIAVTFGGVRAVDGVSVRVEAGQRLAIVGANGAGKTTLFNALTGFVPLSRGTVHLGDLDITGMAAYARVRQGIGRTFQLPRLADTLTVRQNVLAGQAQRPGLPERADWLMERFHIAALAELPIAVLPFGTRRKVEMVRALARHPEVLLVDEPVSGLEDEEVSELLEVLLQLQAAEGWGLVAIEHDLRFVTRVAEHLMVMVDGQVITEGAIDSVLADPRVRRVYLGEEVAV